MGRTEVVASHGWGFDSTCWRGWQGLFGEDADFKVSERGYYGREPQKSAFSDASGPKIALAHSFGLHLLGPDLIGQADLLILFGCFQHFHPAAPQFNRRSRLVLRQMMEQLEDDPRKVLNRFYANTFHPKNPWKLPDGEVDTEQLLNDLKALDTVKISKKVLKTAERICIFHGAEDAIVPRSKGRALYDALKEHAQYFEVRQAGHALPFTHGGRCREILEPMIAELQNR